MFSLGFSATILSPRPLGRLVCVDSPLVRMGKTEGDASVSTRVMVSAMFKVDKHGIFKK